MPNIGTGCVVVGDQANGLPLIIPNAETAFINHNAGKPYLYILTTSAAQGQPTGELASGLIYQNGNNTTRITNTSGSTVGIYVYIYFEIFSPQQSGFIPASDVNVSP
ncbi:hypothetical protein DRH13_00275 [Candidatus Woesebacteria bacterium]|nr:MAG: hypothetical protein DRH13_00275 [Candidatus Woesebacteria bacterium]